MNLILTDMQSTQTIQFSSVPVTLGTVDDWWRNIHHCSKFTKFLI